MLDNDEKVFFILIDNFRLDQWRVVKELLTEYFTFDESLYYSILPTATQICPQLHILGLDAFANRADVSGFVGG